MTETTRIYRSEAGRRRVLAAYDEVLDRWPMPFDRLTLTTPLGETFVLACGPTESSPLVLLHGAGSNSGVWVGGIAPLARDYRVFAVDLPGEPGRSAETRPAWDGPAYGDWLLTVLDGLGLTAASVLGFSQGGWTALKAATRSPARISKLLLLSPGGIIRDNLLFVLQAGFYQMLGAWGLERIKRLVFGAEAVPAALDAYVTLSLREFKPRMETLPIFSDAQLRRLTMPTLVLVGSEDRLRPAAPILERMRRLLPQVTAEVVPGGAHALMNGLDRAGSFLGAPLPSHAHQATSV